MNKYISREAAVDAGYLSDWYISSVGDEPPVWTDAHIDELLNDFIVIPKDTKAADVQPVIHAYWIELPKALNPNENPCKCSSCGHVLSFMNYYPKSKYCDDCGAKMDLKDDDT